MKDARPAARVPALFGGLAVVLLLLSAPVAAQPPTAEPAEDVRSADASEPSETSESSADDAATEDLLRRRFRQIEDLSSVEPRVEAGIATLGGTALSFQDAERAVEIAEKTGGVVSVENQIRIETDVQERVVPAFDRALDRLQDIVSYMPLLLLGLLVLGVFYFLARIVGRFDRIYARVSENAFVQDLARQVVQAVILLVGLLVALEILDATALVGAVLGTAGVIGLAVGFAFRDLVENYISSVLLSLRRPFSPNDHVVIGDHEGKVMRLTSRATILMTLDGNHLRLPNSDVFKGTILNYSRNPKRRFQFDVGVGVEEDLLEAQRLGVEELQDQPKVLDEPPPEAIITKLGDSSVVIRFYGWVDQTEAGFFKVKAEAIRRVKITLENAGMDLPEPIYRVVLRKPGEGPPRPQVVKHHVELEAADPEELAAGDAVDEQIEAEREEGDGKDLLDPASPQE